MNSEAFRETLTERGFTVVWRGGGIGTSATLAAIGGIFGTAALILASPVLARFALQFSSFEFFWLGCLGLSCAVFVSGHDTVKGMASLLIGLLIATVGMDYGTGYPRFTFGSYELMDGVSFIPALIGMFALPEILRSLSATDMIGEVPQISSKESWRKVRGAIRRYWTGALRGSALGTVIGALPGAGADINSEFARFSYSDFLAMADCDLCQQFKIGFAGHAVAE